MSQVPKLCGADVELGNFVLGLDRRGTTCYEASRALLREIPGIDGGTRWASRDQGWQGSPGGVHEGSGRERRRGLLSDGGAEREGTAVPDPRRVRYVDGHPYIDSESLSRSGVEGGFDTHRRPEGRSSRIDPPTSFNPQDWGRKFLPSNGGCFYIDLSHLEICLPEVLSAYDHTACWHAQLRIAQQALASANAGLPEGQRIQALVNNSDGLGNSYGSHQDFLVTRRAWNDLFQARPHYLSFLAAYQVSSIVFTGQGKVGGENGLPAPLGGFQLSARADMIETLVGEQTTFRRPLLNTRDEALCGPRWRSGGSASAIPLEDSLARLHVIFFDNTLCQTACLLKVGVMQIILAMVEARRVDYSLGLDDPLTSLWVWSRDPDLGTQVRLASGRSTTPLELQRRFAESARRFVDRGGCDGFVPNARAIVELWENTLELLEDRDFDALARRLDWVLKRSILERVLSENPSLDWTSPEIKHLDLVYSSLDPNEGLYWTYETAGALDRPVPTDRIEHFLHNPPEDTRAWSRAMWLRKAGSAGVVGVDWDRVDLRVPTARAGHSRTIRIDLADPLGSTRDSTGAVLTDLEASLPESIARTIERDPAAIELRPHSPRDRIEPSATPVGLIPPNTKEWRNGHGYS